MGEKPQKIDLILPFSYNEAGYMLSWVWQMMKNDNTFEVNQIFVSGGTLWHQMPLLLGKSKHLRKCKKMYLKEFDHVFWPYDTFANKDLTNNYFIQTILNIVEWFISNDRMSKLKFKNAKALYSWIISKHTLFKRCRSTHWKDSEKGLSCKRINKNYKKIYIPMNPAKYKGDESKVEWMNLYELRKHNSVSEILNADVGLQPLNDLCYPLRDKDGKKHYYIPSGVEVSIPFDTDMPRSDPTLPMICLMTARKKTNFKNFLKSGQGVGNMMKHLIESVATHGKWSFGFNLVMNHTVDLYTQMYYHSFKDFADYTQKTKDKSWKQGKKDYWKFVDSFKNPVAPSVIMDQLIAGEITVEEFCTPSNEWINRRRFLFKNVANVDLFIEKDPGFAMQFLQNKTIQKVLKAEPQVIGMLLRSPYADMLS